MDNDKIPQLVGSHWDEDQLTVEYQGEVKIIARLAGYGRKDALEAETTVRKNGSVAWGPVIIDWKNQKDLITLHNMAYRTTPGIAWDALFPTVTPILQEALNRKAESDTPEASPLYTAGTPELECPPLPEMDEDPEVIAQLAAGASPWLDDYIALSRRWAPRAFDDYHEACGIFGLSTVAARRVCIEFGAEGMYTSIYAALTGRTSLWTKSTTVTIILGLLRRAGLSALLAPDESTPQAFLSTLAARVPPGYETMTKEQEAQALLRLAFASQRDWFYEEFGQHLAAMMQRDGHMAAFRGILRKLDDHKETYDTNTITRGLENLDKPYLSLLSSLTPADIQPFARAKSTLWSDGYFARFAFIAAPLFGHKNDPYPKGRITYPAQMLKTLRDWHERLGIPSVRIAPVFDAKFHETGEYTLYKDPLPETVYHISPAVWDEYYRYDNALRLLISRAETQDLDGSYARFPVKALRIAGLLASLENEPTLTIQLRHWYRGRAIAERWRASLHRLVAQIQDELPGETREQSVEQLIERALRRSGSLSVRELNKKIRATYSEISKAIEMMRKVGVVAVDDARSDRTTRYGLIVDPSEPPTNGDADTADK